MNITLCGSTRFRTTWEEWNQRLSKMGHVVYSVASFGHDGDTLTDDEKRILDAVHKLKIENSHAIVVLNVGGYIGESTRSEIEHARNLGRMIYWLEPQHGAPGAAVIGPSAVVGELALVRARAPRP